MTKDFHSWRKSRHSDPDGHCVEVGRATDGTIGVRDTKHYGESPILEFTGGEWRKFLDEIRAESP